MNETKENPKKIYTAPRLSVYGDLRKLTGAIGSGTLKDASTKKTL